METVKINLKKPVVTDDIITCHELIESGTSLYIIINEYFDVKVGDIIKFMRSVYCEKGDTLKGVSSYRRTVKNVSYKIVDKKVKVTVIEVDKIEKTRLFIDEVRDWGDREIIDFSSDYNIFSQDIVFAKQKGVTTTLQYYDVADDDFKDIVTNLRVYEGDNIDGTNRRYITSGCQLPESFLVNRWEVIDSNDCGVGTSETPQSEPMYYYIPFKGDLSVIWGDFNDTLTDKLIYYKHNDIYLRTDIIVTSSLYPTIKGYKCYLWEDVSNVVVDGVDYKRKVKKNDIETYNRIVVAKEKGYWDVSVGLSQNSDYTHLSQEELMTTVFTDKIKEAVVESAPVIDMEKVKYAPYVIKDDKYMALTSITYNLHFRCRDIMSEGWQYVENSSSIWNSGVTPDNLSDNDWSDMLYYLGYTDNDVQNQKMNLRKSFIRLSFYDSKDSLSQKLLYYSTIFIDSGELFGKYLKAKNELLKAKKDTNSLVLNSYETDYRLDCHFTVRDEYCTEKSSDGFNFYYFPDAIENGERTIYMKVEFNHAKYGRTIPMVLWPQGKQILDLESAKDCLYIPITIKLLEKDENLNKERLYMYMFQDNKYITVKDNVLTLNLVEPKIGNGDN